MLQSSGSTISEFEARIKAIETERDRALATVSKLEKDVVTHRTARKAADTARDLAVSELAADRDNKTLGKERARLEKALAKSKSDLETAERAIADNSKYAPPQHCEHSLY